MPGVSASRFFLLAPTMQTPRRGVSTSVLRLPLSLCPRAPCRPDSPVFCSPSSCWPRCPRPLNSPSSLTPCIPSPVRRLSTASCSSGADGKIEAVGRRADVRVPAGTLERRAVVVTPGLVDVRATVGPVGAAQPGRRPGRDRQGHPDPARAPRAGRLQRPRPARGVRPPLRRDDGAVRPRARPRRRRADRRGEDAPARRGRRRAARRAHAHDDDRGKHARLFRQPRHARQGRRRAPQGALRGADVRRQARLVPRARPRE